MQYFLRTQEGREFFDNISSIAKSLKQIAGPPPKPASKIPLIDIVILIEISSFEDIQHSSMAAAAVNGIVFDIPSEAELDTVIVDHINSRCFPYYESEGVNTYDIHVYSMANFVEAMNKDEFDTAKVHIAHAQYKVTG
jgi:hypothetical protein